MNATMGEQTLLAVALRALERCGFRWGMHVLVTGHGEQALVLGALAGRCGAASVTLCAQSAGQLDAARRMGFHCHLYGGDAGRLVEEVTGGRGFDVAFELDGSERAYALLLGALKRGARVGLLTGLSGPYTFPVKDMVRSQLRFTGVSGADEAGEARAAKLLAQGADGLFPERGGGQA